MREGRIVVCVDRKIYQIVLRVSFVMFSGFVCREKDVIEVGKSVVYIDISVMVPHCFRPRIEGRELSESKCGLGPIAIIRGVFLFLSGAWSL